MKSMAAHGTFEDIIAWQKSRVFVRKIYEVFGSSKDYSFRDQIVRAAISVMNNIAEGSESGTKKSFRRYLMIAKGSAGEVRSMLYIAHDLRKLSLKDFQELRLQVEEIAKVVSGLAKSLS